VPAYKSLILDSCGTEYENTANWHRKVKVVPKIGQYTFHLPADPLQEDGKGSVVE